MRRFLTTMLLGSLLAAIAMTSSQSVAHACSPALNFRLDADVLIAAGDLDELHSPSGPVQAAYDEWVEAVGWTDSDPLPRIVGVNRSTTVLYAQPPEDASYSSIAAVQAYDTVWGVGPLRGVSPTAFSFDTSTCAGLFDPPSLGESDWRIVTEPASWIDFDPSPDQYVELEAELNRLFGEPERPETDPVEVEARWQHILAQASAEFDSPITDVERLPAFADPTDEVAGSDTTRNIGLAAFALAAAVVGAWGWRRSGTTTN